MLDTIAEAEGISTSSVSFKALFGRGNILSFFIYLKDSLIVFLCLLF